MPQVAPSPRPKPSPPIGNFLTGLQTAKVIDGDTIRLASGERVRLIGVNAPETHHPRIPKEPYGDEATQCLKDILGGQRVRLEVGVDPRDRYKRLLAHVYTESGVYVNSELLKMGCAKLFVMGANVNHLFELVKAQEKGRREQRGVWRE